LVFVIDMRELATHYLDVVPIDVQDTSAQITNLLEGGGGKIERSKRAFITGALVNNNGLDGLAVALVDDLDGFTAGGVFPGLGTHLVSVQGNGGLGLAVPVDVAGTVCVGEPGGLASVLDRGVEGGIGRGGIDLSIGSDAGGGRRGGGGRGGGGRGGGGNGGRRGDGGGGRGDGGG